MDEISIALIAINSSVIFVILLIENINAVHIVRNFTTVTDL
jgi:hypothetical protein